MRQCAILVVVFVLCACNSRSPTEVLITKGMSREAFLKVAREVGAKDTTGFMELECKGRELQEMYWEFEAFKLVVYTDLKGDTLKELTFWKYEDFMRSKSERAEKERPARCIRLHAENKSFKAE